MLTPEQIHDCFQQSSRDKSKERILIARAIESEVRKDYDALIRQMLEALENHDGNYKLSKSAGAAVDAAITAARARLEKAP